MKARLLIAALCFAVVGCTLVDAPLGPNQVPDTPPDSGQVAGVGYYVSPNGSAVGDGSKDAPWDLATALAQPPKVQPGDTIWMLGGTYTNSANDFVIKLKGSTAAPVVLRQYPGERATIDGRLDITGSYAYYWGFEVMDSDPERVTTTPGSDPADLPRQNVTVFITGPFNKVINLVIHDLGDGLFSGSSAQGLEIYGTLLYNNGWDAPDRGHGHSMYLQNQNATKSIIDNVMFNSFSTGLKVGGTGAAYLMNFDIEGNTSFSSGALSTHGYSYNADMEGGAGQLGHSRYIANSFYQPSGLSASVRFGQPGDPPGQDLTFTDNIVKGTVQFNEWSGYTIARNQFTSGSDLLDGQSVLLGFRAANGIALSTNQWNSNVYAVDPASPKVPFYVVQNGVGTLYNFDQWRAATGYDVNGTYVAGRFSQPSVIVRPNQYEPGRAFITCWNWALAPSLAVDVSSVLKPGDKYEIHNVYDVFGPPVLTGTYDGKPITIPQAAMTPPQPIGYSGTPQSTGPEFNVYLLQRI